MMNSRRLVSLMLMLLALAQLGQTREPPARASSAPVVESAPAPEAAVASGDCPPAQSRLFLPLIVRGASAVVNASAPQSAGSNLRRPAPAIEPNTAANFAAATALLYTDDHPLQAGVRPNIIDPSRAAVLRGVPANLYML